MKLITDYIKLSLIFNKLSNASALNVLMFLSRHSCDEALALL